MAQEKRVLESGGKKWEGPRTYNPQGVLWPGHSDRALTRRPKRCCFILGLAVATHLQSSLHCNSCLVVRVINNDRLWLLKACSDTRNILDKALNANTPATATRAASSLAMG